MATITVYADTSDGYIISDDTSDYSLARTGAGSPGLSSDDTSTLLLAGQRKAGADYQVYESFMNFDLFAAGLTSAAVVTAVTLSLYLESDQSATDFICDAWYNSWGSSLTTADFINCATVDTAPILTSIDTASGPTVGAYNDFVENGTALVDNLNSSLALQGAGVVRIALVSRLTLIGQAPTGNEFLRWKSADDASHKPKLTITYTASHPATRYYWEHVAGMNG